MSLAPGAQFDGEQGARGVPGGHEALREQLHAEDRSDENEQTERHGDDSMAHRPCRQTGVAGQQPAVMFVMDGDRPHEVGRKHRRDQPRHQQREHDGDSHGESELAEILTGDAAHEAHRREHGDDGQRNGDDGEADLVGGFQRGAIGRFAGAHVADDVLDFDDGVVHQDARHQGQGEERHQIEREAQRRPWPRTLAAPTEAGRWRP